MIPPRPIYKIASGQACTGWPINLNFPEPVQTRTPGTCTVFMACSGDVTSGRTISFEIQAKVEGADDRWHNLASGTQTNFQVASGTVAGTSTLRLPAAALPHMRVRLISQTGMDADLLDVWVVY